MKTAEEILKDNGFFVMTHKEGSEHVKRAFIEPVIKSMEQYADEVTLGKTLQIHARDQRIEKYRELIEWLNDECPTVSPPLEPYTTADLSHDFAEILRSKLDDLKTELGL